MTSKKMVGFLQHQEEKGEFIATYYYWIIEYRGDGPRLLSEVHQKRMRSNRHRLEHEKFQLDVRDKIGYAGSQTPKRVIMSSCGIPIFGRVQSLEE